MVNRFFELRPLTPVTVGLIMKKMNHSGNPNLANSQGRGRARGRARDAGQNRGRGGGPRGRAGRPPPRGRGVHGGRGGHGPIRGGELHQHIHFHQAQNAPHVEVPGHGEQENAPPALPRLGGPVVAEAELPPREPVDPLVVEMKEPDNQLINNHDRRNLRVSVEFDTFPELDFIGKWNNSAHSELQAIHVDHYGLHFHLVDRQIQLPRSLVPELIAFLAHRRYDEAEFTVLVAHCRRLLLNLQLTPQQLTDAIVYGPPLAWMRHWDTAQSVSRVRRRAYVNSGTVRLSVQKSANFVRRVATPQNFITGVTVSLLSIAGFLFVRSLFRRDKQ